MDAHKGHWAKTIFWGGVTAVLYAAMFYYSDLILHMAHTTPDACVVGHGASAIYYHTSDAAVCAAQGGHIQSGTPWHVMLPILIAFAVSLVHGAFTGLFWDLMGLKPAGHSESHK
jgi:ribose/xylose/arabinose/galactoside ABC-type transport system permease subunit